MGALEFGGAMTPEERSAVYRTLAEGFRYGGAAWEELGIGGADYNDAFDPAVTEGACSLREGAHAEEDQSSIFEELMRFYEFFGLSRDADAEMPDHLSVELEFMHFLTHLESQVADRPDDVASLRMAQRDFLSRHLKRLTEGLSRSLKTEHPGCIELVRMCTGFVQAELSHLAG